MQIKASCAHKEQNKHIRKGASSSRVAFTIICISTLAGCATYLGESGVQTKLEPRSGSNVTGKATLTRQASGGVRLVVDVNGLQPNHVNGFHIHEKGDCSATDGMSAGGHFNPTHGQHGNPTTDMSGRHLGDLPVLQSDAQGHAHAQVTLPTASLDVSNVHNLIGRSLVIHRDPDDYVSQPAGNSGPRVACGVIEVFGGY